MRLAIGPIRPRKKLLARCHQSTRERMTQVEPRGTRLLAGPTGSRKSRLTRDILEETRTCHTQ